MNKLRVRDLPREPARAYFLYCRKCGNHYSATRSDYCFCEPDTILRCYTCRGRPYLLLGVEARTFREVVR
jgi:hypothetical protein